MSPIKFEKPLLINLKPSRYYCHYVKLLHALALLVLLLPYNVSFTVRIICALLIALSFLKTIKMINKYYKGQLYLVAGRQWCWTNNKNNQQALLFKSGASITSKLLILNFIDRENKKFSWCFFPDSGDDQLLRQLRIYLRYSSAESATEIV